MRFAVSLLALLTMASSVFAQASAIDLVRIHVTQPGAYRITGAELRELRPDLARLDPARLVLKLNGEPYPMLLEGLGADGKLVDTSRIVFYANLKPPVDYTNVFGDNAPLINFYQLFFEGDATEALRFALPGKVTSAKPATAVHDVLHFEPNGAWEFFQPPEDSDGLPETDFRFWTKLTRPATSDHETSMSFVYDLSDLSPDGGTGSLRAYLYGVSDLKGDGDHTARLMVNGREIARASWNGMSPMRVAGVIPEDVLRRERNEIAVELVEAGATAPMFDVAMLDWVELVYPRRPVARRDYAYFPSDTKGAHAVSISGFKAVNLTALDVSNARLAPVTVDNGRATVQLEGPTSSVVIYGADTPLGKPRLLEPVRLMGLRAIQTTVDYIAIAPHELVPGLQALVKHRREEGLRVAVVPAEAIYQEFGGGFPSDIAIKEFVRHARANWGAPRYLLLVGDACAVNAIKSQLPTHTDAHGGSHASDNWFAMLEGDDTIPDMAVGRLSVDTPEQLATVCRKIVDRERKPNPGHWREDALFIVASSNWARRAANNLQRYELFPVVGGSLLETDRTATDLEDHKRLTGKIVESLNGGRLFTIFFGHGGGGVWEVGPSIRQELFRAHLFDNDNVRKLTNVDRQTILLAMTCFTNDFNHPHFPETIGESFLRSKGGAAAVLATSGRTTDIGSVRFSRKFFEEAMAGRRERIGDATCEALVAVEDDELRRFMILLGDPASRILLPESIEMGVPRVGATTIDSISGELSGEPYSGQGRLTVSDFTGKVLEQREIQIADGRFEITVARPTGSLRELSWPIAVRVYAFDSLSGRDWLGGVSVEQPE